MIKTVVLTGKEVKADGLGGFNTVVHNLGEDVIYASKYPNVVMGADNVAEIPQGAAKLISTTNGTVYLLGTGKAELTGQDHDGVNFKAPSSLKNDDGELLQLKEYVDNALNSVNGALESKAEKSEIPAALPANGGNAATAEKLMTARKINGVDFDGSADITVPAVDSTARTAAANAQNTAEQAQAAADTNAAAITSTAASTLSSANSYTDTMAGALDTRVSATETAITTLNGTGAGSVKKAVSDGIANVVAGAPTSLDTLKEISDWIGTHTDSAAEMNTQIQTNSADISALQTAKADKSEIPTSLPANGGNAATVNGHTVAKDVPADAKFTDTTYTAATAAPKANGAAAVGTSAKYAREDHVHPLQTSVSGNAGTATKLQTARKINGVAFDGSSDITIKAETNGGNAATVNGHTVAKDVPADAKFTDTTYTAATVTPKANGAAAVGTSAKYAREDHVHPQQTSVSGNAGTATKLQTARKINGVAFDGSADITVTAVDSTARTAASNAQTTANTNATNITSLQNGKFDKTGGTISGNVRIKGSGNYGTKLNFGDGDYVYLHEDTDDHLVIHAGKGVLIDTTGDGLIIDGVKYPTQCLGNDTRFVYPTANGANANNYQTETHVFLMNTQNTPTSHGFLDVSLFDGSYFDFSPSGVIRQRWTDYRTGDEWVRVYRAGEWQSWKILT